MFIVITKYLRWANLRERQRQKGKGKERELKGNQGFLKTQQTQDLLLLHFLTV